jgi:hypothetical protein
MYYIITSEKTNLEIIQTILSDMSEKAQKKYGLAVKDVDKYASFIDKNVGLQPGSKRTTIINNDILNIYKASETELLVSCEIYDDIKQNINWFFRPLIHVYRHFLITLKDKDLKLTYKTYVPCYGTYIFGMNVDNPFAACGRYKFNYSLIIAWICVVAILIIGLAYSGMEKEAYVFIGVVLLVFLGLWMFLCGLYLGLINNYINEFCVLHHYRRTDF